MTLEMSQINHEVVVGKMFAYNVVFQVFLVLNGNANLSELVHQIYGKNAIKTMFMYRFPMLFRVLT